MSSKNFGKAKVEKFEPYKKKTIVDKFYPPSNKQESISIDQIDDSESEIKNYKNRESDILFIDGSDEAIPQEQVFM